MINVTSTSKIRKIIPTRKNFIQNCNREVPEGSNPHSNGPLFSLSSNVLYLIILLINKKPTEKLIMMIEYILTLNIYTIDLCLFTRILPISDPNPTAASHAPIQINISAKNISFLIVIIDLMTINRNNSKESKMVSGCFFFNPKHLMSKTSVNNSSLIIYLKKSILSFHSRTGTFRTK